MIKTDLRFKLFTIVMLSILFGITSVGTALYYQFKGYLYTQVETVLQQYVLLSEKALETDSLRTANLEYLKSFADEQSRITNCRFTLIAADGRVIADSEIPIKHLATVENHLTRPEVQASLNNEFGTDRRFSSTINKEQFYISRSVYVSDGNIGFIRVSVFAASTDKLLATIRRYSIYGGLIILLISGMLLLLLSRRINSNLRKVIQHAGDIASGDLKPKLNIESKDELGKLSIALNEMSSRLSSTITKLSHEREDLNMVLSSIKEGIIALDENGRIILFNDIGLNMLKHARKKGISNRHFSEVIEHPHLIGLIENFLKTPYLISDELNAEDNSIIEVVLNPFSIRHRKREGAVVVLRDITKFKTLEKIRRDFVANVSHEFKTPLSAIRGYSETLLDWALADSRLNKKYVKKIVKQSRQLENLVSDLLQLARIERLQSIELKAFNPSPVIHDVINQYFELAEGKDIEISSRLSKKPFKIKGDPEMFRSIIANLIDNAIKYTPFDGTVKISSSVNSEHAFISVEDSGIGIPQKHQERIFERFYRVDKSRSSTTAGTGLGLSIVRHLAEIQEAEVELRSQPNSGSCFSLKFLRHSG
ncbi:MAG: HAMP domain-containing sensor histidine kinase [Calditrichia bacterium]